MVRRLFHALITVIDPSPLPKNKRLDKAKAAKLVRDADDATLDQKRVRLIQVVNAILQTSLQPVQGLLDKHWDGSLGLDATPISTWAKGLKTSGPVTATDPDAGWYVRDGDHADPDTQPKTKSKPRKSSGSKGKRRRSICSATTPPSPSPATLTSPAPPTTDGNGDPKAIPALVLGMTLDKPGHRPGPNAIAVLADIAARGHPTGYLAADRLYNNNSDPHTFQLPARALGYQPVYDYREDQLGIQTQAHGALLVDGAWYCPATPDAIINATADFLAEKTDADTWRTRIAACEAFRLNPKGLPDAEGHRRLSCPAAAGRVECPLKTASMGTNSRLPLVVPQPSPVGPPKICRQDSITMAPEHGAQHWQPLAHGSPEWQQHYFRLRNSVEGVNGYAKASTTKPSNAPAPAASAASPPKPCSSRSNSPTPTPARSTDGSTPSPTTPVKRDGARPGDEPPNRSGHGHRAATNGSQNPTPPEQSSPRHSRDERCPKSARTRSTIRQR